MSFSLAPSSVQGTAHLKSPFLKLHFSGDSFDNLKTKFKQDRFARQSIYT